MSTYNFGERKKYIDNMILLNNKNDFPSLGTSQDYQLNVDYKNIIESLKSCENGFTETKETIQSIPQIKLPPLPTLRRNFIEDIHAWDVLDRLTCYF